MHIGLEDFIYLQMYFRDGSHAIRAPIVLNSGTILFLHKLYRSINHIYDAIIAN